MLWSIVPVVRPIRHVFTAIIAGALLTGLVPAFGAGQLTQVISGGPPTGRAIAVTFDAGADRGYAPRVLQTLERFRVRATFGVTGRWAESNPDLVRRMARDGDAIMNHTVDHRSFTGLSSRSAPLSLSERAWEITRAETIVRHLTGRSTRPYFRPPFGDYDSAELSLLPRLGYRYMIMWTVDSLGWEHLAPSAILARCLARASPGEIILMHVGIQSQDAIALPALLTALERRGYRLVTVPAMLHHA